VAVDGPLVVDDAEIQVRAALDGFGVVWTLEHYAAPFCSSGRLARVLEGWCAPFPG
jgi:DNA-binding transcriptional LysR family regulator